MEPTQRMVNGRWRVVDKDDKEVKKLGERLDRMTSRKYIRTRKTVLIKVCTGHGVPIDEGPVAYISRDYEKSETESESESEIVQQNIVRKRKLQQKSGGKGGKAKSSVKRRRIESESDSGSEISEAGETDTDTECEDEVEIEMNHRSDDLDDDLDHDDDAAGQGQNNGANGYEGGQSPQSGTATEGDFSEDEQYQSHQTDNDHYSVSVRSGNKWGGDWFEDLLDEEYWRPIPVIMGYPKNGKNLSKKENETREQVLIRLK